ncbi:tryptophan 2,3-dioxygenase family protein [Streptomyces sp.]|uniref:tryptophan 2,3-dioxygenase family protein n=1 Tax=Streptomyces sp. TaxID=1931 RepID=UPI002D428185|nr:tryptophan 2,3-dioxygenase family protein [Streptomyces sp.]HZF91486.1 tryptophan 2,3-dioxygenase family protein [Streptomyces sp.]
METPYACYLQLPDLLDLQQPRSPKDRPAQWADEHFFITVHQSAEVLVSQALVDLDRAARQARSGQDAGAATSLRRVTAVVDVLAAHLALLDHLAPDSFASFRPLLGNASGAQSSQFTELFRRIAMPDCLGSAGGEGQTQSGEGQEQSGDGQTEGRQAADALWSLRAAVTRWRTRHLLLVERMIGDRPGTGGTSGLAYLRSRIDLPPRG